MKRIDPALVFNEEALTRQSLAKKTTILRFRLPMTSVQAYSMLRAFYRAEVIYRNREFVEDEFTTMVLQRLADALTVGSKFGLLMCGSCGNGKTTCINAIRELIVWLKQADYLPDSQPGLVIHSAKDLARLAGSNEDKFRQTCYLPMLAIDDIGEEPREVVSYGNVHNPIIDLLERRYADQLPTFATTNLTPDGVSKKYGERIRDRLFEMFDVLAFDNTNSYRQL
jgi:DNA replication protein DnaC